MTQIWSRAKHSIQRKKERSIFPDDHPPQRIDFKATFESENCQPTIGKLLSWEYGRMYLQECDDFHVQTRVSNKKEFINPGIEDWVLKRRSPPENRQAQRIDEKVQNRRQSEMRISGGTVTGQRGYKHHRPQDTIRRMGDYRNPKCVGRRGGCGNDEQRHDVSVNSVRDGDFVRRDKVCVTRGVSDNRGKN